jgi:hypothetical protein
VQDPLWTERDRNEALVWASEEQHICKGCGHHREDSFDVESDGDWVAKVWVCHSCAARERKSKQIAGELPGAYVLTERA